jgi:spectrin beta
VKKTKSALHLFPWRLLGTYFLSGLEEARGILDFNNEVAKIESWIRDKELMVSQGDLGKDYEHCMELQKKLDDVDSDMRVDESRIGKTFQMADK